jgi:hypothetical protein
MKGRDHGSNGRNGTRIGTASRTTAGRAGSFNPKEHRSSRLRPFGHYGKKVTVLPVEKVPRTGTGDSAAGWIVAVLMSGRKNKTDGPGPTHVSEPVGEPAALVRIGPMGCAADGAHGVPVDSDPWEVRRSIPAPGGDAF